VLGPDITVAPECRTVSPFMYGVRGRPAAGRIAHRGRARSPLLRLARRPRTRGRDGHRELRRGLDRCRDVSAGLASPHRHGPPRCGGHRSGGPHRRRRLGPVRARDPGPFIPRPCALPCRSRHHRRRSEGDHGCRRQSLGHLCRLRGHDRPDAARPSRRHRHPDAGALGRERSDRRARLRPGLCHRLRRGALRGPARHRARAPVGDPDLVLQTIWEWGAASRKGASTA
jgi:hypothetical protein